MSTSNSLYQHFLSHRTVCTDTRSITKDCLFFALKGENFDANSFAAQALNLGAAYAIIDNPDFLLDDRTILVPDVLTALQQLAKYHREQLHIPVIGLTGSNGKTTTKELINAVLSEKYKTFATKGNLNNHIGVPLSLLSLTSETEIAVIEMGANHQKEIEFLCELAQPTHGLITNIGMAHLDGFGGFEGVKKGKAELFAYLKKHDGTAFINRDNPYLLEMTAAADLTKTVYYGKQANNTISGTLLKTDPFLELSWTDQVKKHEVHTQLTGAYNFENILAAIVISHFFGLTEAEINAGLSGYQPKNNRSQLSKTDKNTVICDFYNANPSSMIAALANIASLSATKKVVIIGDMFELGSEAAAQHQLIISEAEKTHINTLIFIGKHFYDEKGAHRGHFFQSPAEAKEFLEKESIADSLVLLKGSRGMALEQLLPLL
ncbi:UDP-N-acetylmuramoyl-tripeptide--D-alanyl-D-alanine ligase [Pedobacter gandavensis]|uniref:UDP-N-acetylmuramoyl-tripeptide--D-alanyl-D-alanine ligase n=1 Tax=Pedobacter gandavensis TaxID=2679963 RepID=A0ABR6EXT2_9SPHI|nr:UDP-N-acetylmuramoyl-tripeptide--D-alanyl-D-alanine ligase [Pedobacter gandavensis]MBB2150095.1 UDP-N-acetylmuramoyl-tripeptide--D-alanyl-D-alanine ligase [Pedobacter gandavensis]